MGPEPVTPRPRKWKRILSAFAEGRSLNRFDAERIGDHVLHSTVAAIEARGVRIERQEETISGYGGAPTRCKRYRLAPESRSRALELLGPSA